LSLTDFIPQEKPAVTSQAPDHPATVARPASDAMPPVRSRRATVSRWQKFWSYYQPHKGIFLADMACALLGSAATLALLLCAQYITTNILRSHAPHSLERIYGMGALMLALVGVYAACTLFIDFQGHMMGARMEGDMRRELFDHLQALSFRFYDEQRTGQLMSRITSDTFALAELYHHGPEDILTTALTVTGAFIILLRINVGMTLIVFLFLPILAAYALYFNMKMNRALLRSKERIADINAQVEDTLAGIRVVKAFTNEARERGKFVHANQQFLVSRSDGYRSEANLSAGLLAGAQLIIIAVVVFGAIAITRANLTVADLVTYLLCVGILTTPIEKLVNFVRLYQEGMTGFERFMELLNMAPDLEDAPDARELPQLRGQVTFQNVSFTYRDDLPLVLNNLSLEIQAGEYVALVGMSGVGKTTLCALIPRFYDVTAGAILLDGQDVRAVTQRSLRRQIGVVQQDVYLFAGTVADNIRYGKLDASREEVIAAAKQAHAHEFIMALPDGYDTDIGQRGVKLSGGQKQRLSIARVFLKNPPLIIFDEATSALDNESERAIQASVERLANNRTMLVIAHRLSTIRNAQRIVVLSDAGIAEQGTHEELLALNGVYANLYTMQAKI